ncbi:septum formation initiator family protein [Candidatus Babeliales bacterium]|nr:septum formation initiator family protein [Candidatus Babeliales bacterium]
MLSLKQTLFRIFFGIEVVVFIFMYLCGTHGIQARRQLHIENLGLSDKIAAQRIEVAKLECEIDRWKTDSFYKEKLAREHLGLAREGDIVYYRSSITE